MTQTQRDKEVRVCRLQVGVNMIGLPIYSVYLIKNTENKGKKSVHVRQLNSII